MTATKKYFLGEYELDPSTYTLLRGSTPTAVSRMRFEVLLYLVEERHRVVTRQEVIARFWDGHEVYEENLTKCISDLRKALDDQQKPHRCIETVPAVGYRYIGHVEERANANDSPAQEQMPGVAGELDRVEESSGEPPSLPAEAADDSRNALPLPVPQSSIQPLAIVLMLVLAAFTAAAVFLYSRTTQSNAAGDSSTIRSLAILPFKPISNQDRDEFLELGMADALITKLSNIRQVAVAPTGSVRKYTSLTQDPIAAGKELRVDSVLEGSVQKLHQRIRVTVRLIRISDRSLLWAETLDEESADIFSLQDSISEKVVKALAVRLSTPEQEQIAKRYTQNGEAYQLYQKGRYFWNKRTADGLTKSIEFLEQATQKDPNYALAYAGLADSYIAATNFNVLAPKEVYPKAKQAARKALEIDKSLAEAHAALAFSIMLFDWDWDAAEAEFRQAIDLSPNYGPAHQWYAVSLVSSGRFSEAIAEAKKAQQVEPLSLFINAGVGWVSFLARDYDGTIDECNKAIEMDSSFAPAYVYRGMAYEQKRMLDKAVADLETARDLQARPSIMGALGHAYAVAGQKSKARMILQQLNELSAKQYFPPYHLALIHVGLGENDEAVKLLERAYDERYPWLIHLNAEPRLDPLRADQHFRGLIRRIGLPPQLVFLPLPVAHP